MITAAAILKDRTIYTGKRHSTIIADYKGRVSFKNCEQGFVDKSGRFFTREEAKAYAIEVGQIKDNFRRILTSEDLW